MALPPIDSFTNPWDHDVRTTLWELRNQFAQAKYATSKDQYANYYRNALRIMLAMIRGIRADISEEELFIAVANNAWDDIITKIENRARIAFGEIIAISYGDSVRDMVEWARDLKLIRVDQVGLVRDQVNIRTQFQNEQNALGLVREFVNEQRTQLDQATGLRTIGDRIRETGRPGDFLGQNPREVADRTFQMRNIKRRIGLTYYQWRSVDKVETLLRTQDYSNLRHFRTNEYGIRSSTRPLFDDELMALVTPFMERTDAGTFKPMPERLIRRIVDQYTDNKIVSRLETISRTEMLRNVNAGKHDANEMMIERGDIQRDWQTRRWDSSLDNRVRDSHKRPLHGQAYGSVQPGAYVTNEGNTCQYPCDPSLPAGDSINCRCQEVYELEIPVNDLLAHVPGIDEAFPLS